MAALPTTGALLSLLTQPGLWPVKVSTAGTAQPASSDGLFPLLLDLSVPEEETPLPAEGLKDEDAAAAASKLSELIRFLPGIAPLPSQPQPAALTLPRITTEAVSPPSKVGETELPITPVVRLAAPLPDTPAEAAPRLPALSMEPSAIPSQAPHPAPPSAPGATAPTVRPVAVAADDRSKPPADLPQPSPATSKKEAAPDRQPEIVQPSLTVTSRPAEEVSPPKRSGKPIQPEAPPSKTVDPVTPPSPAGSSIIALPAPAPAIASSCPEPRPNSATHQTSSSQEAISPTGDRPVPMSGTPAPVPDLATSPGDPTRAGTAEIAVTMVLKPIATAPHRTANPSETAIAVEVADGPLVPVVRPTGETLRAATVPHTATPATVAAPPARPSKPRDPDEPPAIAPAIRPTAAFKPWPHSSPAIVEQHSPSADATPPEVSEASPPAAPLAEASAAPKPGVVARDIRLEVAGGERRVEVRLSERAGEVRVAVRTGDSHLSGAIRENLPALSTRLAEAGFRTETWRPAAASSESSLTQTNPGNPPQDSNSSTQQQNQGQQPGGGDSRRQRAPQQPIEPKEKGKDFAWLMSSLQ